MRVADDIIQCSLFLYTSVDAANRGEPAGASAFLVGVKATLDDRLYTYVVTNAHVLDKCPEPAARLNYRDGRSKAVFTDARHWIRHPRGDDVAIHPIGVPDDVDHKVITTSLFLTQDLVRKHNIGPGDEVFMVGRLKDHEGSQRVRPSLRFGTVAMMPDEPVKQPSGHLQESFIAEMRSLAGYSGSPAFLYIPSLVARPPQWALTTESRGPWLMGVDWGHHRLWNPVVDCCGRELGNGWKVEANSGIAFVVPAWQLQELLFSPELVAFRQMEDERRATRL